ncbi:cyanophycinase [Bacillus tianshenii]|uniref:Cyanophycinase n=1 Tax=Sutcliffiella tianshenii TaxID=1463404 RepID=A0ABS2NZ95_9BACI|nr:Type 1 glutamine amidotransferase-like domain-containing protein [Bacillus tianshenii]MBM7620011.1 cyanophycinase [Bacillus tianshenii]
MNRHLFLFGGGPPFTGDMAKQFATKALAGGSPVSILFVEREGWEEYMHWYTQELERFGVSEFNYLPLPSTPIEVVFERVKNSSGIVIGGGDTNLYADYIVDTPISQAIKERYEAGIPVAGFSAGALISPEVCVISPKDNEQNEYQSRKGLGLATDVVVAVHFSEWEDEDHLRNAVSKYKESMNYGIDENTGVYLLDGELEAMEGNGVYTVEDGVLRKLN